MNIDEYKRKVIMFFSEGRARKEQWEEMANAVLNASEVGETLHIDMYILPEDEYRKQYITEL